MMAPHGVRGIESGALEVRWWCGIESGCGAREWGRLEGSWLTFETPWYGIRSLVLRFPDPVFASLSRDTQRNGIGERRHLCQRRRDGQVARVRDFGNLRSASHRATRNSPRDPLSRGGESRVKWDKLLRFRMGRHQIRNLDPDPFL